MASNHAMLASEVINKSPVLGARDDEQADLVVGIRSGAGDPGLSSERMSWFPSRISSMAAGPLLFIVLSSIGSKRRAAARLLVPVWS